MPAEPDIFDDPRLTAYVLGELSEQDCAPLEREIANSPALAAEVESLRRSAEAVSQALLAELATVARSGFEAGDLPSRVVRHPANRLPCVQHAPPQRKTRSTRRGWSALGPMALAMAAALIVFAQATPIILPTSNLIASNSSVPSHSQYGNDAYRFHILAPPSNSRTWERGLARPEAESINGNVTPQSLSLSNQLYFEAVDPPLAVSNSISVDLGMRGLSTEAHFMGQEPNRPIHLNRQPAGDPKRSSAPTHEKLGRFAKEQAPQVPALQKQQTSEGKTASDADGLVQALPEQPAVAGSVRKGHEVHPASPPVQLGDGIAEETLPVDARWRMYESFADSEGVPVTNWSDFSWDTQRFDVLAIPLPASGPQTAVEVTPLPPEVALRRAECNGRYSDLRRQVSAPADVVRYGRFHDAGALSTKRQQEPAQSSAEYGVYVAPHWYIWGHRSDTP